MDVLADLLRGIRADGALFDRQVLSAAPWSLRYDTGAPLTLCTVAAGAARLIPATGETVGLSGGATALVRGPAAFTIADAPDHEGPTELIVGAYRAHADIGRRLPDALPD